jgi:hypothetical protein
VEERLPVVERKKKERGDERADKWARHHKMIGKVHLL